LKNIFSKDLILVAWKCIKHVLTTPNVEKYLFSRLDSGGLEMHQNTFLTTQTLKNIFSKDLILVTWKFIKTRF
jgi:hypothetical protein